MYGSILVNGVRKINYGMIGGERGAFRPGRGCAAQLFALKQLVKKVR